MNNTIYFIVLAQNGAIPFEVAAALSNHVSRFRSARGQSTTPTIGCQELELLGHVGTFLAEPSANIATNDTSV